MSLGRPSAGPEGPREDPTLRVLRIFFVNGLFTALSLHVMMQALRLTKRDDGGSAALCQGSKLAGMTYLVLHIRETANSRWAVTGERTMQPSSTTTLSAATIGTIEKGTKRKVSVRPFVKTT